MKRYVIDSVQDIRAFLTDLHLRTGAAFLPEDNLGGLFDAGGKTVFSKAEIAYFDDILLDCFVFCNDHHLDLHEIVESLQQELGFSETQQYAKTKQPVTPYSAVPVFATP